MAENAKTVILRDKRIAFDVERQNILNVGGHFVSYNTVSFPNFTGLTTGGSVSVSFSDTQALCRSLCFHWYGQANITLVPNSVAQGTAAALPTVCVLPGSLALASNPFYKVLQSIQYTIGGNAQVWSNVSDTVDMLSRVRRNNYTAWTFLSGTAQMTDIGNDFVNFYNSNANVLGNFRDMPPGNLEELRGNCIRINVNPQINQGAQPPASAVIQVSFDIYAPFTYGVFNSAQHDAPAIVRPNSLQFQLSPNSKVFKMFKYAPLQATSAITNVAITSSTLNLIYMTIDITNFIPNERMLYGSFTVDYTSQSGNVNVAAGAQALTTINQISFSHQPELILLGCRIIADKDTIAGCSVPDRYLPITAATINYQQNNVLNLSAGGYQQTAGACYTPEFQRILYDISRRNGLSQSWTEFAGLNVSGGDQYVNGATTQYHTCGSFLVLSPGRDLLSADSIATAPGMAASGNGFNFSGSIGIANNTTSNLTAADYEIVIIRVVPQRFYEVSLGNYMQTDLAIDMTSVKEVVDMSTEEDLQGSLIKKPMGGSFWKDFGKGFKMVFDKAVKYGPKIVDAAQKYGPLLLGAGRRQQPSDDEDAAEYEEMEMREQRGGARLSRPQMREIRDSYQSRPRQVNISDFSK